MSDSATSPGDTRRRQIVEIFASELQRDDFANSDDFFDLGGDSIKAMRIIWRLAERLDAHLTVTDFFIEDPTMSVLLEKAATSTGPEDSKINTPAT